MHRPDDPRSAFGEMVEATAGSTGVQLTRFCTEVVTRAMPEILERLTDHMTAQIEQRFAMIENRQRVNLNVRAPKRRLARPVAQKQKLCFNIVVGMSLPGSSTQMRHGCDHSSSSRIRVSAGPRPPREGIHETGP